ncbi:hypothetical protein RUM44_005667 [Polyplax serrata]|uniref:TMEM205-like domain-containing protein n=1 Tax=Polyplax serrata TaxID=468196 RepID=A0ABR1AW71_POLSC
MDDKLNELKEKQQEIGDKISLLHETNKKKDEAAEEIRKLIAECKESINRIKSNSCGETVLPPCSQLEDSEAPSKRCSTKEGSKDSRKCTPKDSCNGTMETKRPCGSKTSNFDRKRCSELLAKKEPCKPPETKKKKKGKDKDRLTCQVDLNSMKVRVRGPPEDLKKLDATQLINLLESHQCQELIINTGEEIIRDPGEIRLFYCLHPGNIVMIAGIIMIAFLINANLCGQTRSCKMKFLLNVLYLSSFALHYGMVLWMSFVRGYALQFGLNDDNFHLVDNLILPKYFSVCVLLSALSLYSFLATHCVAPCTSWPLEVVAQMIVIVATFFMELFTICYVVPGLIKLRDATDDYTMGDDEPDCSVPDSYRKNLTKLGKINWTLCLINFLTLVFLGANMYYLTSKLNIGDSK